MTDLADFFVEVADTLVDEFDVVDFLDNLTAKAAAVSGAAAVGLVLSDHRGRVRFMAASNESGKMLELLQLQNDEGPCLECLTSGVPVINADLAHAADRWPNFAPRALEAGFQSVHAFPMRLRNQVIGALNLFGSEDSRFEDDESRVVQALADVATIAILQERHIIQAETLTEQLQGALNSRIVIEQAKGALAQADGISTSDAFDLLRSRARSTRQRLVDVAQDVLAGLETRP
ncbi:MULTISPECIES: ANTAR domain-containing response regulator [unclassified Nocardioides]|uniref:ANTAR domain-containing response regulator n=1 Tax=unclassified Nocardioides TaxID=2615069 RepID=UPI001F6071F3|nr:MULTISPECIES: GAF and ANTAR domain-containing protein [unclassified Nocardioides]